MSKIGKFFANISIVAYAIIAISVTVLLLSYNQYHCSVLGGYTFILVTDDELEEYGYEEGSLVLVKETKAKNIEAGDDIFLYRRISSAQFEIKYAEIILKDTSKGENDVSYLLEGGIVVNHEDVIGSEKNITVVPHLGTILSILESRYGYLFLIVVVSFIAFLYEIYELIMEIKYGEREEDEEDYEEDDDDEYEDDEEYDDEEYEDEEVEEVVKPKKTAKTAKTAKKVTTKKATAKVATAKKTPTKKSATVKKSTPKKSTTSTTAKKSTTSKSGTAKKATTAKKAGTTKSK